MEGKEVRFGISGSTLWATATTAASNGSVNSMHDSYTPLGGLVPMVLMQLGEVVFGGVGSGLYGMLVFVIIAVFVAGLMVGRTPEYLGKKIEAFEIKMAALVILIPPITILLGTALAVITATGTASMSNAGPHVLSQALYAFSSAAGNNGSTFAGLRTNTLFYNVTLSVAMLAGRYALIVPVLAMAGSMAQKKKAPPSTGTLPTHTPLFAGWLMAVCHWWARWCSCPHWPSVRLSSTCCSSRALPSEGCAMTATASRSTHPPTAAPGHPGLVCQAQPPAAGAQFCHVRGPKPAVCLPTLLFLRAHWPQ